MLPYWLSSAIYWLSFNLLINGEKYKLHKEVSIPTSSPTNPIWIETVHLVISNHFDCGFYADYPKFGFAATVVNNYFHNYFPSAVSNGIILNNNYSLPFTWMTQSWLISLYFDCPPNMGFTCPNQTEQEYIQYGIDKGYIYWHSFPFNSQMEVYDKSMLEFGLKLSKDLSIKHGAPISSTLSQRDVPGMTRSMIPILNKNNITAISIGVNEVSASPKVPQIFKWKDTQSNESIITMVNPGGYGDVYFPDPIYFSNWNEALVFAWSGDNNGPPTVEDVVGYFSQISTEFPNATIIASSITNFVRNLTKNPDVVDSLPVVEEEIGDTWTHGIQSDPWKTAVNRVAQRQRDQCLKSGQCSLNSIALYNFSRLLLKNGEHTWGGDIKSFLQWTNTESQYFAWSNQQFYAALAADNNNSSPIPPWTLTNFRSTWDEQRRWGINYALDALSLSTNPTDRLLYHDIMTEINHITSPKSPFDSLSNKQWQKVDVDQSFTVKSSFDNRKYQIKFDSNNGALTELTNMEYNIKFASNDNLIGQFIYQTLTEQDFDNFMSEYSIVQPQPEWMLADFGKQELDFNANPIHQYITAEFRNLYQSSMDLNEFVVEMDFGEQQMNLTKYYGIPQNIYNYISFNSNSSTFTMEITYINKTMTRIPEDIYFKFDPVNCSDWKLEKFGEYVDLKDIVKNGTAHMHNINNRAYCANINGNDAAGFMIRGIDSGLTVFPPKLPKGRNEFSPFPTPFVEASENDGIGFVLYDNTWGTNYPVWWPFHEYDANTTYRFEILLQ